MIFSILKFLETDEIIFSPIESTTTTGTTATAANDAKCSSRGLSTGIHFLSLISVARKLSISNLIINFKIFRFLKLANAATTSRTGENGIRTNVTESNDEPTRKSDASSANAARTNATANAATHTTTDNANATK